jgi:hypothetical protein
MSNTSRASLAGHANLNWIGLFGSPPGRGEGWVLKRRQASGLRRQAIKWLPSRGADPPAGGGGARLQDRFVVKGLGVGFNKTNEKSFLLLCVTP